MKSYHWENKLSMDECALLAKARENESIVDYITYNFYTNGDYEERMQELNQVAWDNPNLRFRDGYGVASEQLINKDSETRYNVALTHGPEKRQLVVRSFTAVPDISRGSYAPNTESYLLNGLDTSGIRQCIRTTEMDFNRFVPFTDCINRHIQEGALAIPNELPIGMNSRDIVRKQFKENGKCGLESQ